MSGFIGPKPADVPVGTIATKGTLSGNSLVVGTNNATIGNSVYVVANGNVGVGNASPAHTLSVKGRIYSTDIIIANNGGESLYLSPGVSANHTYLSIFARSNAPTTRSGWFGYGGSGEVDLRISNELIGAVQLQSNNGTGNLYVAANGNIGINNTTPTSSLSVSGTSTFSGAASFSSNASFSGVATFSANASFEKGLRVVGNVAFSGSSSGPGTFSFEYPYTRFYIGDATGYSFAFSKRAANTTTDILTIQDNTNAVAIGALPTYSKFDVKGNNEDSVVSIYSANGAIRFRPYVSAIAGGQIAGMNSTHSAYAGLTIDGSPLSFATAGSERMYIAANGNIGIGTATPSDKLDLYGKIHIGDYPNSYGQMYISAGQNARIQFGDQTAASTGYTLKFGTGTQASPVDLMTLEAATGKLSVSGEVFTGRVDASVEGGQIGFGRSSDNARLYAIDCYGSGSNPELRMFNDLTPVVFFSASNTGVNYIKFNPSQSAQGDANCLDDYEEGMWTPACGTAGVSVSNINHAKYTKIGRYVHATTYITLNNTSGGTKNYIQLTGLPFVSDGYGPIMKYYGLSAVTTDLYMEASTTYGQMNFSAGSPLPTGASGWMFNFTYLTSS